MLFAKVAVALPPEGPFDYIVPDELRQKIKTGSRVWVNFGFKKIVGFIVGLSAKSGIKNHKKILGLIDESPVLDKDMLALTRELSQYYCCSWGLAIQAALPEALRKGKIIPPIEKVQKFPPSGPSEITLVHDLAAMRMELYLEYIKEAVQSNLGVIILLPDINAVLKTKELISKKFDLAVGVLYRKEAQEIEEWMRAKSGKSAIVIGTRSAIFAPLPNLGLVIIDEEENSVYKQEQVPHYHAREVGMMRVKIDNAKLVLGSVSPSVKSFYLAKKGSIKYKTLPRERAFPEIKIIDLKFERQNLRPVFSKYLQDAIAQSLVAKKKSLLFLNRRGFATASTCNNCQAVLKCPRCEISLVYLFKENLLSCRHCNFKMDLPKICPSCNAGYIKFSGAGTEKVESEIFRVFPQAKILRLDDDAHDLNSADADIFVATSAIFKQANLNFDLIGVLGIDNALNRVDFRAGEKAFAILAGLLSICSKKFIVQTHFPKHSCFGALLSKTNDSFYEEELKQRKQLGFPPYKHMALVKLRAKIEEKARGKALALFSKMAEAPKPRGLNVISANPAEQAKLRGNFYWQILLSSTSVSKIGKFLKLQLKDFRHSGIIVTVDVDPL